MCQSGPSGSHKPTSPQAHNHPRTRGEKVRSLAQLRTDDRVLYWLPRVAQAGLDVTGFNPKKHTRVTVRGA